MDWMLPEYALVIAWQLKVIYSAFTCIETLQIFTICQIDLKEEIIYVINAIHVAL